MNLFRNLFLTNRFFLAGAATVVLFVFGFIFPVLFPLAQIVLIALIAFFVLDIILLFRTSSQVLCKRTVGKMFSLGNENPVRLDIINHSAQQLKLTIIDEIPFQFQKRDMRMRLVLESGEKQSLGYNLRPVVRGEYVFNNVNIFGQTQFGLVQRRFVKEAREMIKVYPSVIDMKKYELLAMAKISIYQGVKKIRRLGHSYEFEQIKNYVMGDDFRSINWKATSRKADLMVNQYEDERSQQVYSLIDKSRTMRMPFNGLSLLDYSINASLVISNIALKKHDKSGLLTFSDKIGSSIKADRGQKQLRMILEALYNEEERKMEANYELMYNAVRNLVRGRSLIFFYTNFESLYAVERVLPLLRRINSTHLLVVMFFENTEVKDFSVSAAKDVEEIYLKTIAQKFVSEKNQVVQLLRQYGIQSILTRPEDLSINTVNKYLELKARGMI
jgi:uncharacterized protein (DUF58 family)